jgi:hypothetical protein
LWKGGALARKKGGGFYLFEGLVVSIVCEFHKLQIFLGIATAEGVILHDMTYISRIHIPRNGADSDSQNNGRYEPCVRGNVAHLVILCSAMIAARTPSSGELIHSVCSTAKNRRLVLPSIGDDQA